MRKAAKAQPVAKRRVPCLAGLSAIPIEPEDRMPAIGNAGFASAMHPWQCFQSACITKVCWINFVTKKPSRNSLAPEVMSKGSFAEMNCPIAQTLEQVGEWWTLLILRNAFCGMTRFQEFQQHLGIGTNVLSQRLRQLTEDGILERSAAQHDGRAVEYRLTEKGSALYPILIAMAEWGEKWVPNPKGARIRLVERGTGEPIAGICVQAADGRSLQAQEIAAVAGPAADAKTHELSCYSLPAYIA